MLLHFSKMHGLGNDFVMISDRQLADLVVAALSQVGGKTSRSAAPSFDAQRLKQFCSRLASTLCDRHFGIGGDGLIVAIDLAHMLSAAQDSGAGTKGQATGQSTAIADVSSTHSTFWRALDQFTASYPERAACRLAWIYVNSDGSYAEMCGNGLRCFTLFARELGLIKGSTCSVATVAYPVVVTIQDRDKSDQTSAAGASGSGKEAAAKTDAACTARGGEAKASSGSADSIEVVTRLAGPQFNSTAIPLNTSILAADQESFIDQTIEVNGLQLKATCVSMGNPHCIIFEQKNLSLDRYAADIKAAHAAGRALETFPEDLVNLGGDIQKLSLFPAGTNVEFVRIDTEEPDTAIVFVVERGCGATLACASGAAAVLAVGAKSGRLNKKSYVILPGGKLQVSLSSVKEKKHVHEYIELTGPAMKVFSGDVPVRLGPLTGEPTKAASAPGASACSSAAPGAVSKSNKSSELSAKSAESSAKSSSKFGEGLCV